LESLVSYFVALAKPVLIPVVLVLLGIACVKASGSSSSRPDSSARRAKRCTAHTRRRGGPPPEPMIRLDSAQRAGNAAASKRRQ